MSMPFRLPFRAHIACVALAVVGPACAAPFAPADLAGTYALVAINGLTPPHVASVNYTVVSDTILLAADGRGTWISVAHIYPTTGPARLFERASHTVTVVRRGGNLWLREWPRCNDTADCAPHEPGYVLLTAMGEDLYVGQSPLLRTLRRVAP